MSQPTKKYELVFIVESQMTEEQIREQIEKIGGVISNNGGSLTDSKIWGKRRLAYQIEKRREGNYVQVDFEAVPDSTVLPELERYLRISEDIMRSLVTVAVVGKSKGRELTPEEQARFSYRPGGRRTFREKERDDRGGPRPDRSSDRGGERPAAPAAAPAAATEAPAAPEQPAAPAAEAPGTGEATS